MPDFPISLSWPTSDTPPAAYGSRVTVNPSDDTVTATYQDAAELRYVLDTLRLLVLVRELGGVVAGVVE